MGARTWQLRRRCAPGVLLVSLLVLLAAPQIVAASGAGTLCFVRDGALYAAPAGANPRLVASLPAAQTYQLRQAGPGHVLVECSNAEWVSSSAAMEGAETRFVVASLSGATLDLGARLGEAESLSVSEDGAKVALVRAGALYVGTGTRVTKVASLPGDLVHGLQWSHDASRIAFVAARSGGDFGQSPEQLYIFDGATSQTLQLTHNLDLTDMGGQARIFAPQFSAGDRSVGFIQGRRSDSRSLDLVRPDGTSVSGSGQGAGAESVLADFTMSFAHTGSSVLYSAGNCDHGNFQTEHLVYRLDDRAGAPSPGNPMSPNGGSNIDPTFSLDDSLVAWARWPGLRVGSMDLGRIWLAHSDGADAHELGAGVSPLWVSSGATGVEAPAFIAASTVFTEFVDVSIRCDTPGATVRYTTDGTLPTKSSPVYARPLHLTATTELVAKAFKDGMSESSATRIKYCRDSDGDGLPDEWETKGIDTNGDGVIEVDLPAMGANPRRKDLFIQVDWMQTEPSFAFMGWTIGGSQHKPKPEALAKVIEAFKNAPVSNPDGSRGVSVHIDAGPESIMDPTTGEIWGDRSESRFVTEVSNLDVHQDSSGNWDWSAFDAIKNVKFSRARAFHYCLFVNKYGGEGSTGLSRGIPGGDFIVADGAGGGNLNVTEQAGTLMHEFGHNLGLRHGGGDSVHYKPNYLSIMNYSFQLSGLRKNRKDGTIDYSRDRLNALNESSIDEGAGIGPKKAVGDLGTVYRRNGKNERVLTLTGWINSPYRKDSLSGAIDWNGTGGDHQSGYAMDLNTGTGKGDPPMVSGEVLSGFDDWDHIVYGGGSDHAIGVSDPSAPGVHATGVIASSEVAEPSYQDFVKQGLVLRDYNVSVEGSGVVQGFAGAPGTTIHFLITNSGETTDTFRVSAAGFTGVDASSVPSTVRLGPGGTRGIEVGIAIPAGTAAGSTFVVVLTARSVSSPEIVDQATSLVTVRRPEVAASNSTGTGPGIAFLVIVALFGAAGLSVTLTRLSAAKGMTSSPLAQPGAAASTFPATVLRISDAHGTRDVRVELPSVIGRSADSEVVIRDPKISSRHARLVRADDGSIEIEDTGSANGVHVGDLRVSTSVVRVGDSIRLGDTTLELLPEEVPVWGSSD